MENVKKPAIWQAVLPILILIVTALLSVLKWKVGMHIPLMAGIIATSILATYLGYKWSEQEKFLMDGVYRALLPCFLLFIIGTIIATWIQSGVIPAMIYYSLKFIDPSYFIPIAALGTAVLSITIGSSFTSIATIGVAFLAVGQAMGFPPALVAGAVISGAYFGDKLSPLSDTTNLAPAVCETDLISHVKHMLWDTVPALAISVIIYFFVSQQFTTNDASLQRIDNILDTLSQSFNLNPFLLLLPVLTIALIIKRVPVIPTLMLVSVLGGVVALVVQGSSLSQVIQAMANGFTIETGLKEVDSLLNRGGLVSMYGIIALIILSTGLGGIMEGIGVFKVLLHSLIQKARTTGSLIALTVISTLAVGFASGAQWLALILPGRSFASTYKERGLDTKNLSRCIEAGGTVGINLVPWSTNAIFAVTMLGVPTLSYLPYSYFILIVPLINIIYGFLGITIAKKTYPETISMDSLDTKEQGNKEEII